MGYYKDSRGIKCFTPDDTENCFYIEVGFISWDMQHIMEKAREKWGDIGFERLSIGAEHINTGCLGYDQYDPSDYTNCLLITLLPEDENS